MDSHAQTGWMWPQLSPELRLLTKCISASFINLGMPDGRESYRFVDWELFVNLARRHRIEGLARNGLRVLTIDTPPDAMRELSIAARGIAEQGLRTAAHSEQLRNAFTSELIPLFFIKGLVVGTLAYGDPFMKNARDIDILIPLEKLQNAIPVLRAMGHCPIHPAGSDEDIIRWHRISKESVWRSADGRLTVELHSALTDHAGLLAGMNVTNDCLHVEVTPGLSLPTLPKDEQFAYLCVHGASSAWFRIKWIADLAGVISGATESELARLVGTAKKLGAGRSTRQALLLACWLFPILRYDSHLAIEFRADRISGWLARRSLSQMLGPEPSSRLFGTATIHLTQLVQTSRWKDGAGELVRQLSFPWRRRAFIFDE